ncbi:RlpA-like double-psi beta-barrel-protein domain-containing protein-containing protein [Favolaschia claudopus]|uniref:RlpA-like double-psi beta-barrel-protein domain-containing protein-containing protein n=1 Tax=Favolaschia claudopus TaxID=2862362 RepID=A0AAW0AYF9_9AGAR
MVSFKFFATVLPLVLTAAVNASPALSSANGALSVLSKRACSRSYTVVGGDTCAAIEAKTGVSDANLHTFNPSINSGCTNLQIGQVLCLANSGSGGSCAQTYTVVSGDTCAVIEAKTGTSDANLHAMNPSINGGCTNLQIGQVLCVGGGGGSPPGGGGTTFTGLATYYDPNGGTGACGSVLQNSDFIVALGSGHYDGGAHCGKTVTVTYQGRTISVTVADLCPGCQGANGIDLSEGAMAALDSNYINDGVITVQWTLPN